MLVVMNVKIATVNIQLFKGNVNNGLRWIIQSSLLIIVKAWFLRGSSFVVALTFLVLVTLTLIHNIGYDVQALSPTPQFTPRAHRQSGPHHAVVHVTASNHCTAISPFHCTHHQSTPSTFINIAIFILFWHSNHYTIQNLSQNHFCHTENTIQMFRRLANLLFGKGNFSVTFLFTTDNDFS